MTSPSNAGGAGSIPGGVAKIPHALGPKNQNIKQKQYCNKFNKDFKIGPHQKKILKKNKPNNSSLNVKKKKKSISSFFLLRSELYHQSNITS